MSNVRTILSKYENLQYIFEHFTNIEQILLKFLPILAFLFDFFGNAGFFAILNCERVSLPASHSY